MVKFDIKLIITILLFAFCIYVEDYVQRGVGMFVGIAITCVGLLFGNSSYRREELRDYFSLVGCALCFFFFISIGMGVHFKEVPKGIKVLSAFYTHEIGSGDRLETKQLHSYYTQYYNKYEVKADTYYFVYKGESCYIYNEYSKLLTLPVSFTILQRDFGHGKLHNIVVNSKTYDMRGTEIKDGYTPYISDITPDYTTSPIN